METNIVLLQQHMKAMEEKMAEMEKENTSLREIAAVKQSQSLLDEEIQALKAEIEKMGEQRRKKVEVESLKKKLFDLKNADNPENMMGDAQQYSIDAMPEDYDKIKVMVRLHMDRQLTGRKLESYQKKFAEQYVQNMSAFIAGYKKAQKTAFFKNNYEGTGRLPGELNHAVNEAHVNSKYHLLFKPIIDTDPFAAK